MAPAPRVDVVGARLARALVVLLVLGRAVPVAAQESQDSTPPPPGATSSESQASPPPSEGAPAPSSTGTPAERPPRREVPNYRQLDSEPTTAGDVFIWVPRVVLLPAFLVTEYIPGCDLRTLLHHLRAAPRFEIAVASGTPEITEVMDVGGGDVAMTGTLGMESSDGIAVIGATSSRSP